MSTSTTIIMAIIISFAVSVILCPIVIPILKKMKFGRSYCNIFDFYDSGKEY